MTKKKKKKKKKKILVVSCPTGRCLGTGICSMRSNGGYNCSCCENGFLFFTFFLCFFFKQKRNDLFFKKVAICPEISERNVTWKETLAINETVTANCLSGYFGSVSRYCYQYGTEGVWGNDFIGTCEG